MFYPQKIHKSVLSRVSTVHKLLGLYKISIISFSTQSNSKELDTEKFDTIAEQWWDLDGPMKALHDFNSIRLQYVKKYKGVMETNGPICSDRPLKSQKVIDVGCGAGILSEGLARLGAKVVGIDSSDAVIKVAQKHAANLNFQFLHEIEYRCCTLKEVVNKEAGMYDTVVASEVIEHVQNQDEFVQDCLTCLRPQGSLIISTINRTEISRWLAIWAAENVLNLVPAGMHEWDLFVTPQELLKWVTKDKKAIHLNTQGLLYLPPPIRRWLHVPSDSMNYIAAFQKN